MVHFVVVESEEDSAGEAPAKDFRPTVEWMSQKYDEMNTWLFEGKLGACSFDIFTTGNGSEGRTLGKFSIKGSHIFVNKRTRRLYKSEWSGNIGSVDITKDNFVELCKPTILLNGHYSGTEHAFLGTLVHEMCHYYNYMNGWSPTQAHGKEFKSIAHVVSSRSGGEFTVQRLASAEQMQEYELDDDMKAKRDRRLQNKKEDMMAVIVYYIGKEVRLSLTKSMTLAKHIIDYSAQKEKLSTKGVCTDDPEIIDFLFKKGYTKAFRTWRWWDIGKQPWIEELNQKVDALKLGSEETGTFGYKTLKPWNPSLVAETDEPIEILPSMNLGLQAPAN